MRLLPALFAAALLPGAVSAMDIASSAFRASSALVADGFVPFATSGVGNVLYGLMKDDQLYLCFLADTGDAQAERQATLLAELRGEAPDPALPNIPVICVLTQ